MLCSAASVPTLESCARGAGNVRLLLELSEQGKVSAEGRPAEANYTDKNVRASFIMSEGQIAAHNERRIDERCLHLCSLQMLISVTRS